MLGNKPNWLTDVESKCAPCELHYTIIQMCSMWTTLHYNPNVLHVNYTTLESKCALCELHYSSNVLYLKYITVQMCPMRTTLEPKCTPCELHWRPNSLHMNSMYAPIGLHVNYTYYPHGSQIHSCSQIHGCIGQSQARHGWKWFTMTQEQIYNDVKKYSYKYCNCANPTI